MRVGFVGLGSMGTIIVNLLLAGGHDVTLWARRPASLEPFPSCASVESPAALGRACDLVGICVWDEAGVQDVLLGPDGVLSGMGPGGVITIHSTISPEACRQIRDEAARSGVDVIDAPVSIGAAAPKLLLLLGGDPAVLARIRPAIDSIGDPAVLLGDVGAGQIAKLVNNTLLAAQVGLADDAVLMGADLGLDADALLAALSVGSAGGNWSGLLAARSGRPDNPNRTNQWASKDVGLAKAEAAAGGLDGSRDLLRLGDRGVGILG